MFEKQYIAIDLKSFFASVECVERGLDPLNTNLVVADEGRTEKTICLAVSPSLKAYGIPGRARLYEVVQKARDINYRRLCEYRKKLRDPGAEFSGSSYADGELKNDPSLELSYIVAEPRMSYYMDYSARAYRVYLKYFAPEDIHVYSVDEVFIDATAYLKTYGMTARQLAGRVIKDVLDTTGITATSGIGTNLYLAKVAMDIVAKHMPPDENGVRTAELDEMSYRRELWSHRPLTDFWRVGGGYASKLEKIGIYTMGDIAKCSVAKENEYRNEALLYKLFGVNAELLIDHAWGWEPCTIADIKAYRPMTNSLSSGQVLQCPYEHDKTGLIVREMADLLSLELAQKGLVTNQLVLTIGYDIENLTNPAIRENYRGETVTDHYGRQIPKHSHGTINLEKYTCSTRRITEAVTELFDKISDPNLLSRRINITANHIMSEAQAEQSSACEQLDLFTDYAQAERERVILEKEKNMQQAILKMKDKYGKNAVLRGMNLRDGATTISRNAQIGGHKA